MRKVNKTRAKAGSLTTLTVGGIMASAIMASADTATLTQNPALSWDDGGAFDVVTAQNNFAQFYAPSALDGNAFQTFCVQQSILFWPSTPYYYVLSQEDTSGRQLTMGAAYLYYEFSTAQLTGYFGANQNVAAGELQSALWALQGGQTAPGFPDYSTDPFYTLAINKFGGVAGAEAASDGAFGVDIMQLWDVSGNQTSYQNQLVYLGVPDTASNIALLGATAAGLALASRRLKNSPTPPALAGVRAS